jgi:predicted HTH domain antitoxin
MQVSLNFPDVYFSLYDKSTLIEEIQISLALMLFKQGRISITKAAHISNKDIYEFMKECSKNEIPVINITPDEFDKEWESLKKDFL